MRPRFRFEELEVWCEARKLKQNVYRASRDFPKDELYALTSQLRRAALSVACNIAEGAGRNSDRDFARFLEQAYGSLMETASLLFLAVDEGYIPEEACDALFEQADLVARKLVSLNRSVSVDASKTPFARRRTDPRLLTLDSRLSTLAPRL